MGQKRSQQFLKLEEAGEAGELRVGEGTAATDVDVAGKVSRSQMTAQSLKAQQRHRTGQLFEGRKSLESLKKEMTRSSVHHNYPHFQEFSLTSTSLYYRMCKIIDN